MAPLSSELHEPRLRRAEEEKGISSHLELTRLLRQQLEAEVAKDSTDLPHLLRSRGN